MRNGTLRNSLPLGEPCLPELRTSQTLEMEYPVLISSGDSSAASEEAKAMLSASSLCPDVPLAVDAAAPTSSAASDTTMPTPQMVSRFIQAVQH